LRTRRGDAQAQTSSTHCGESNLCQQLHPAGFATLVHMHWGPSVAPYSPITQQISMTWLLRQCMGTERRFCERFTDYSTGGLLAGQQDQAASYTGPYHQTSADKHQSTFGRCWHNLPGFTCTTSAEMMIAEVCAPEALHCCKTEGARECIELRDHRSQIWYHTLPVEPFKIFGKNEHLPTQSRLESSAADKLSCPRGL